MAPSSMSGSMVSPTRSDRRPGPFRWVSAAGAAAMIGTVLLAFFSTDHSDDRTDVYLDESAFNGMPDPNQAVYSADHTVNSVAGFRDSENPAGQFASAPLIPRMLTRPRYAAMLGKEAALHASSQPFLVSLERNGQKVPGAIAPFGEYAPVTPAYSNPVARYIPNVTYYPVGRNMPSTGGDKNVPIFNPFDTDNSTQRFLPNSERAKLLQVEEGATISKYLAHLYSALATQQNALDAHNEEESKIQAAIQRVQRIAEAQTGMKLAQPWEQAHNVFSAPPAQPEELMPEIAPQQYVVSPSSYYAPYQTRTAQQSNRAEYMRPVIRIVSPRGLSAADDEEMPQFA